MEFTDTHGYVSKRVAGYVRVSTFEQAEKGTSIDEQRRIISEECNKRGWELSAIYCDEGVSGKIAQRPGLQLLQKEALIKRFQVIMFTKSDRLTRSLRDLNNLWHDWTEAGLQIICVEQPEINSEGLCGKLIRSLLGIFAEWERETIIERTSSGRMARWKNHEAVIGALPYGYDFDDEHQKIVLNPQKALICRRIFKMYLNRDLATRDIAVRLTKASVPTPRSDSCCWHYATINKILKNPAYAGTAEYNKHKYVTMINKNNQYYTTRSKETKDKAKWITVEFPPIISKNQHIRILNQMDVKSKKFDRIDEIYARIFMLENVTLLCGECGGKMKMHLMRKKKIPQPYVYYRCCWNKATRKEVEAQYRERGRCDMRVDVSTLDNYVFAQVMEFLNGIVVSVRDGLMDLSLKTIMERINSWPKTSVENRKPLQLGYKENECNDYWEFTHITEIEWTSIRESCERYLKRRRYVNKKHEDSKRRYDLIGKHGEKILKVTNRRLISPGKIDFSETVSSYTETMSFEQRKSIVESVIAPEKGGKCVIKWARNHGEIDLVHSPLTKKGKFPQGEFRKYPFMIEITFYVNLQKIHQLILGAQGTDLFSREKGDEWQSDGITGQYVKPYCPPNKELPQKSRERPDDEYPEDH